MSTARARQGQFFHFRIQGVKFVGTWEQVRVILSAMSMDTAHASA